jgi:hypothetical protein
MRRTASSASGEIGLASLPAQRCTPPAARPRLQSRQTSCARWRCRRRSSSGRSPPCARSWSRSASGSYATAAISCSSWPRWRCRANSSPRSSTESIGSGQGRRRSRHEHREQRSMATRQTRCVHDRPRAVQRRPKLRSKPHDAALWSEATGWRPPRLAQMRRNDASLALGSWTSGESRLWSVPP